ncbi:SPOR domain-containing protein [Gammaproteobacteria bacterium]|nr:SPOR domain-containing protein [Gammaproteobacteria bacterium]
MEQNIKNRLVGIVVIFALAVIFLPMILDGSGMRKEKFEIVIPPPPVVDSNSQFDTKIIELNAKAEAIPELEQQFVDEVSSENRVKRTQGADKMSEKQGHEPKSTTASATAVVEPAKVGGISWVLQVGSFQDRNKALVQRDKLRKSNISAVFIEQFNVNNKPSYRVRLGPFVNREQTRVAQNKIKAKHDIDGIIMKYER